MKAASKSSGDSETHKKEVAQLNREIEQLKETSVEEAAKFKKLKKVAKKIRDQLIKSQKNVTAQEEKIAKLQEELDDCEEEEDDEDDD